MKKPIAKPLLKVSGLNVDCRSKKILSNLCFEIPPKTVTSIVGPSGVGKTTLLRSINRLLDESKDYLITGKIQLRGDDLYKPGVSKYELRRQIGLVFQKPTIFPVSIFKNVIFGIKHIAPKPRSEYLPLVEKCLRDAFLWDEVKDRLNDHAADLSVGQQQRLAISRSLAVDPQVLMMDEPTSSLDKNAAQKIEQLIVKLKEEKSILIVTHDPKQAAAISDQIIILKPNDSGATGQTITDKSLFERNYSA